MKRIVTITEHRYYIETIQHTIEIPDMALDEIGDFLTDNDDLYQPDLDRKVGNGELNLHTIDQRYDVEEIVEVKKHVWGGTL